MGSFQVYAMPVFDMMETLLVKNGFSNALPYRLLCRSAYVIAVGFFAITLPFFGSLLGFLGATHCIPTAYMHTTFAACASGYAVSILMCKHMVAI